MQLLGPWCEWGGGCRGRGRQWDLLGRSCKVSAFFTSPLRLSDATPSFRMTPQCPPGSLVGRLASVVSKSSSRSSRGLIVGGVGGGPPWSTVAAPSTQRPTRRLNLVQTVSRTPPGSAFGRGGDGRGYKGTGKGTQRHKDLTPKAEDQRPKTDDRRLKAESLRPKTYDRRLKAENLRPKTYKTEG